MKSALLIGTILFLIAPLLAIAKPDAVPGEFVVRLKDSYDLNKESKYLSKTLGGTIKKIIPNLNMLVLIKPSIEKEDFSLASLQSHPLVAVAEPNYIYHSSAIPNDPMFSSLWGLKNNQKTDGNYQSEYTNVDISAEKAWNLETGSKNIIVAVIDSGMDLEHEDLKENLWVNEVEAHGLPGVDDDNNGYIDDIHGFDFIKQKGFVVDEFGHGSHCAGVIGARGDNGVGITGVNWQTSLMALRILDANGSGSLDSAIEAVVYATLMGARVISNSWGGSKISENLRLAIEASHKAGAVFVAAAGNDSANNDNVPTYPASYKVPNVIAVAAVDSYGDKAYFSNYGKRSVHVAAPGVDILSTYASGGYYTWSGTSMATPHVAGVAALLLSREPKLSNVEVKDRLMKTAKPTKGLIGAIQGRGVVNAYSALTNEISPADANDPANWKQKKVSISSAHPYGNNSKVSFQVEVPGAKQIAIYFSRLETQNLFDRVHIYDGIGKQIDVLWGNGDDSFSNVIDGSKAKIVLTSDKAEAAYGFDVTQIAWR